MLSNFTAAVLVFLLFTAAITFQNPSLIHWNKKFDNAKEALMNKSHKLHCKHPNAHSDEELK